MAGEVLRASTASWLASKKKEDEGDTIHNGIALITRIREVCERAGGPSLASHHNGDHLALGKKTKELRRYAPIS